ncbi:hypothetical protein Nepgr_010548 [Nepenthes gracilis]|uniref:KANL2-like probable zinc-finger domain-containing protein n=1 Tax=Nepenthes gracilis TaxID=150966 RepID=A0AAD3SCM7_NEPGR|nr:hypothetical protein Nepgr_010548 [Nepenthes gracilis]
MASSSKLYSTRREMLSHALASAAELQTQKNSNKISDLNNEKAPNANPTTIQSLSQSTNKSILSPSPEDLSLSMSSHLTRPELLRRRLHHLKQLSRVYRDHYWALMEDLRVQYREYYWKFGMSPYKDEEETEITDKEINIEGSGETNNNNIFNDGANNNNDNHAAKSGLRLGFGECEFESKLGGKNQCAFLGCKLKAMALTNFCHLHILSDPHQKLYKACNYVIKSAQTGPIICGKPIMRSRVPSLCNVHLQKAQKHVAQALKKARLNVSSSSKLAPKFHVIVAEYSNYLILRGEGISHQSAPYPHIEGGIELKLATHNGIDQAIPQCNWTSASIFGGRRKRSAETSNFPDLRGKRDSSRRAPLHKTSTSETSRLQIVIDIEHLKRKASLSLQRTLNSCEFKFNQIASSAAEAYEDLQNLISYDSSSNRVIISCREMTVRFVGELLLWSCVVVIAVRFLVKLALGLRIRNQFGATKMVRRRDRSLAGREVAVGRRFEERETKLKEFWPAERVLNTVPKNRIQREERELPKWWPAAAATSSLVSMVDREEYQKAANKIIRAIMDDRISGKDISEDDIIELRRICRISGARVSIETVNARDSVYRLSVDFVLRTCCKATGSYVQIDGEDPQLFVAGLADNICLPSTRAATIVAAAVAARTRSWFLEAWALEMQQKHSEAVEELSKICAIHRIFPPESSSPEMEMVAQGLEKLLKVQQREFLLNTLVGICGEESQKSAAEALGLLPG